MKVINNFCVVVLALILCLSLYSKPVFGKPILEPANLYPVISKGIVFSNNHLAIFRWLFGPRVKTESNGQPGGRVSAGIRGKCSNISQFFTALVPSVEELDSSEFESELLSKALETTYLGLTTKDFPILWFFLPTVPNAVEKLELMIQDEKNFDILRTPISVDMPSIGGGVPGIYGIDLSQFKDQFVQSSQGGFALNQSYRWHLSLVCNAERPSQNPSIQAWIKHVSLFNGVENELFSKQSPVEKADLYIDQEIWHDALSILIMEGQVEEWISLLDSIGIVIEPDTLLFGIINH